MIGQRPTAAQQDQDSQQHGGVQAAYPFLRLRRFLRFRGGFRLRLLSRALGHVDRTHRAGGVDCPSRALLHAGTCGGFPVLHERHQVGLVYGVQEIDGVLTVRRPVHNNIKGIAALGLDGDKLLIPGSVTLNVVHDG